MYQWIKLKIQFITNMNARLTELYRSCKTKEALASQDSFNSADVLIGSEVEKFAKLIIKECSSYVEGTGNWLVAMEMKQHFEVEE